MQFQLEQREDLYIGSFQAMASPCEVLIETQDKPLASKLTDIAATEAWRIECKFSRYKKENIIHRINNAMGKTIEVDEETSKLLNFSHQCYELSDGLFDITSGILRKAWTFDGSDHLPEQSQIDPLLELIGWQKLNWADPFLSMPSGMQIDFGGIGKEYAVDRVLGLLISQSSCPLLVNFGGDLHASGARSQQRPWITGIENPMQPGDACNTLELYQGALATSGDAFRFLEKDSIRYSHVLNPKTGWPATEAPHSITVAAENCTQAGILATLAMLQGRMAEAFLDSQQVKYWAYR